MPPVPPGESGKAEDAHAEDSHAELHAELHAEDAHAEDAHAEDAHAELHAELAMFNRAVGGWRGAVDSGLPTAVFVVAYLASGRSLRPALIGAVAAGIVVLVWRLVRRQRFTQALAGFVGLAVSAYVAKQTGNASNFYLLGLLTNAAYALGLLLTLVFRWPFLGLAVGALRGDLSGWRSDPVRRRTYTVATWAWFAVFAVRLVVEVPLYALGLVGALGVAKLVLGLPLYLLAAYLTYRLLVPPLGATSAAAAGGIASEPSGATDAGAAE